MTYLSRNVFSKLWVPICNAKGQLIGHSSMRPFSDSQAGVDTAKRNVFTFVYILYHATCVSACVWRGCAWKYTVFCSFVFFHLFVACKHPRPGRTTPCWYSKPWLIEIWEHDAGIWPHGDGIIWWKRDHIEGEWGEEEEEEGKWRKRRVGLDKLVWWPILVRAAAILPRINFLTCDSLEVTLRLQQLSWLPFP